MERFLSQDSLIALSDLRTGNLSTRAWNELSRSAHELSKSQLFIDDSYPLSISDLKTTCQNFKTIIMEGTLTTRTTSILETDTLEPDLGWTKCPL
jgi:hypothetical protein